MIETYNGLIRGNVPDIIAASGKVANYRTLSKDEHKEHLLLKLVKEANEVITSAKDRNKLVEELGDVLDVFWLIAKSFGVDGSEIHFSRTLKRFKYGDFEGRYFLEGIEDGCSAKQLGDRDED